MERTLAIIKPDGVARGIIGEVIKRLEDKNFKIIAMKMIHLSKKQAEGFYAVHLGKPFFESLTDFMSSGPAVVMVLEGEDIIARYRELMGATNYKEAAEGTIRKAFATDIEKNVVHGSDAPETAAFEMAYFLTTLKLSANACHHQFKECFCDFMSAALPGKYRCCCPGDVQHGHRSTACG